VAIKFVKQCFDVRLQMLGLRCNISRPCSYEVPGGAAATSRLVGLPAQHFGLVAQAKHCNL